MKKTINLLLFAVLVLFLTSCGGNSNTSEKVNNNKSDSSANGSDKKSEADNGPVADKNMTNPQPVSANKIIYIYNFHLVNRCASCIAIENATVKTLKTYFSKEQESGRIRFSSINVEADANKALAEKYQASGSSLFVTGTVNGKEKTFDLTADGFKYAKTKEDKFISILKAKLEELLK